MERIKLNKGLIAIGSMKNEGKTRFALKLANHIAQNENVLYISYTDYRERLIAIIEGMDGSVNENLEVNSGFSYNGSSTFLEMFKYAKNNNISTIFLDDIDNFCGEDSYDSYTNMNSRVIQGMKYLSESLDIKFIFLTNITKIMSDETYNSSSPRIRDFRWSRRIINDCTQIFGLYRPSTRGIVQDADGNSLYDTIEIYHLKNNKNKEEMFVLDNRELMIYNNQY